MAAVTWVPDGQSLKQNTVCCAGSRTALLHSGQGSVQWAPEDRESSWVGEREAITSAVKALSILVCFMLHRAGS